MHRLKSTMDQSYMAVLQLSTKVDDLTVMCSALQVKPERPPSSKVLNTASEDSEVLQLASFKAQMLLTNQMPSSELDSLECKEVQIKTSNTVRSEAVYNGKRVWVEWKKYIPEQPSDAWWKELIEDRTKKLAILLGSEKKNLRNFEHRDA